MTLLEELEILIRCIWEDADSSIIEQKFAPDARLYGLEEDEIVGPKEFAAFHRMLILQFADIRLNIFKGVEQGEWGAFSFYISARDRESAGRVSSMGYLMARIVDGRVVEGMNFLDFLTIFEQSGRLPPRTRDMCMVGNRLLLAPAPSKQTH